MVAAATDLFGRKGWPATTTDEIAARAGVTKRTLYKYFPSKQALLYEVGQSFVEANRTRVAELSAVEGSPTERMRAFVLGYVQVALSSQARFAVFLEEVKHLDDEQWTYFLDRGAEWITLVRRIVEDGKASGDFDPALDTSVATFTILSMVRGMVHWVRPKGAMSKAQLAEHTARLVLDGLGVRQPV
jgi:AcrR family transcriptional regulator